MSNFISSLLILFLLVAMLTIDDAKAIMNTSSVSAILVFGDSTVDPGNNNYVKTLFKSNFPPYGISFINRLPTGRFSDGKLPTDYIASYLGIKEYVPAYLDPKLSINELMTGVSFASAGSGYDSLTPRISNVIGMTEQLEYLKEYKTRLETEIGKERTQSLINNAVFFISAGTNDFVVNYFGLPIRRRSFTLPNYQHFLIQNVRSFIQALWDNGARKIGIASLPPMGCLPVVITPYSRNPLLGRSCIGSYSSVAKDYNQMLQNEVNAMQRSIAKQGGRIVYGDIYSPLDSMIQSGEKYGFSKVSTGCCGTGLIEATLLCNSLSSVCADVSKHVFWDSVHPTTKAYRIVFENLKPHLDFIIQN